MGADENGGGYSISIPGVYRATSITYTEIQGRVSIKEGVTLIIDENTEITFTDAKGHSNCMFNVDGGTLIMNGGTLTNNKNIYSGFNNVIQVNNGAFIMNGGSISGNDSVGVYVNMGLFEMNNGTITGNQASIVSTNGAGVMVHNGAFNMKGGTISGNTAAGNGGGVYVNYGTFSMSGGTITNNTADGNGPEVYLNSGGDGVNNALTMSGGKILPNEGECAIYVNAPYWDDWYEPMVPLGMISLTGNVTIAGEGIYWGNSRDSAKPATIMLDDSFSAETPIKVTVADSTFGTPIVSGADVYDPQYFDLQNTGEGGIPLYLVFDDTDQLIISTEEPILPEPEDPSTPEQPGTGEPSEDEEESEPSLPSTPISDGWHDYSLGKMYYADGKRTRGWADIDGERYYFDEKGFMVTGWREIEPDSGDWYHFGPDGVLDYGWYKEGNVWYYLDPVTGLMYNDGLSTIDKSTYYFYDWGGMASDWWYEAEDGWYFFGGSGAMKAAQWLEWKGDWYYLTEAGKMAADTYIGEYYVDADGVWVK